jgi:hypothetical protein
MQEKIDVYFLSDEERVLQVLKLSRNQRVSFNTCNPEEELKIFGFADLERLSAALSSLLSKRLIFIRSEYAPNSQGRLEEYARKVGLTKKFASALKVVIPT